MFQHAAAKGWKEAEWIVCQGHWQKLPQLNLEASIPAIQLVGPETSEKELQELYLEVYKLHRLPGSPPGEPALLEEVVSSLKDHQGWREERTSTVTVRSQLADPQPSRSGASRKGKGTAQWRRVWPPYVRPTKKHWPQQLPSRKKLKDWPTPRLALRWGWGPRAGTTRNVVGQNERGGAIRCGLRTVLPPTIPLAQGQSPAKKQLPLKVWIWKSHQSWDWRWHPSWEGQWKPMGWRQQDASRTCHHRI